MPYIPSQPIELSCVAFFANDTRVRITLFPLASHGREHPLDLLMGFLNGRKGEYFPVRTPDGKELLIPLHDCYVFELSREDERRTIAQYPGMEEHSINRSSSTVVSYALVSVTLKNNRSVRGSIWFHGYDPESSRNLMEFMNQETRYLLLHSEKCSHLVRRDAVVRAQIFSGEDMGDSTQVKGLPDSAMHDSRLVDISMGFHPGDPISPSIPPPAVSGEAFLKPEGVNAEHLERVAKTTIFPRPSRKDIEKR